MHPLNRRIFLSKVVPSALSLCLLPLAACAHRDRRQKSINSIPALDSLIADFESRIPQLMMELNVPGVSIAVIGNAQIVWRRGFGIKDAASQNPVDHETVFQAASMSKPVFAYLVLKLCEQGVIGLDTPLSQFAPEPFLTGDPRLELITPRHLLSHSSGFQNFRSSKAPLKIHFTPGAEFRYSGEGYYYLQSVITHLIGRIDRNDCATFEADLAVCASDFGKFMAQNILQPFGMTSSSYLADELDQRQLASGHDATGKPFPRVKSTGPAVARYGAVGELLTTPTDYAKFMIEVLAPHGPDNFRLKKETNAEMLRRQVKAVQGAKTSSWALGWEVQDNGLINHGGDNRGFHCHAIASRETRSGFVLMTNSDNGPQLIKKVLEKEIDSFFGFGPKSA